MARIVFYGNETTGLISLLTTLADPRHEVIVLLADKLEWINIVHGIVPSIASLPWLIPDQIPMSGLCKNADLLLCCHGRQIIDMDYLEGGNPDKAWYPGIQHGGINIHPYLALYPGVDPVGRAIMGQVDYLSVSAHRMTAEVDSGEVVAEVYKSLSGNIPSTWSREHLYNRLYPLYAEVTAKVLKTVAEVDKWQESQVQQEAQRRVRQGRGKYSRSRSK